jgi:hypothetical protein
MSYNITIYSKEIQENDRLLKMRFDSLLGISSYGSSVIDNFLFDFKQWKKERKYRHDLIIFDNDLSEFEIIDVVNKISKFNGDIWWGVINNTSVDNAKLNHLGCKYCMPRRAPSIKKSVVDMVKNKISNYTKYLLDD